MARRGTFGRSTTGSTNLSAMIQSLVRQQQQDEERVFMQAFYDGTAYNGKIPTMDDVIAFYGNFAKLAGFERGGVESIALQQKITAANNFDIKRVYAKLIADFQATGGKNYGEVLSFLKGRATTSTDTQDLAAYEGAVGDITQSYIRYKGEALGRGEITAAEYRQMTGELLSQISPSDPRYYQTLTDSYTYEWNAEKAKWDNRLVAGKVSKSQYAAWAKEFGQSLISAGISKDSEIYTATLAAAARAVGAGGGPPSATVQRLDKTSSDLGSLFALGSNVLGIDVGVKDLGDLLTLSQGDKLKKLYEHPEVLSGLADYLDNHPSYTNPILVQLGLKTGDDVRVFVNDSVRSGHSDATTIAQNGGRDNTGIWMNIAVTNGAATGVDEFGAASLKWTKDKAAANGNDVLLSYYNKEWKKYLAGDPKEPSIYGARPDNFGTPEILSLYQTELNAANGVLTEGAITLSGSMNSQVDADWVNHQATDQNAKAAVTGNGVLLWDENTGKYNFSPKQASGVGGGVYQYTEFQKVNGQVVAYVVAVQGQQVVTYDNNNKPVAAGWVYLVPGTDPNLPRKTIVTDEMGNELTGADLRYANGKWTFGDKGAGTSTGRGPSTVNLDPLKVYGSKAAALIPYNPADPEARRALALGEGSYIDSATLRQAAVAAGQVAGAMDMNTAATNAVDINTDVLGLAQQQELSIAMSAPDANTVQGQLRIEQIKGGTTVTDRAKALQFVASNPDKVTEVAPGYYIAKPTSSQGGIDLGAAALGAGIGAASLAPLGIPLGPVGVGIAGAAGAVAGAAGPLIGGLIGGTPGMPQVLDTRTDEQKRAAYAAGAATPQAQQYQATGYSAGSGTFFRNLQQPTATSALPVSPYLALQSTPPIAVPKPAAPPTPSVLPAFTPEDPEARRAMLLAPVPPPVISSGPRKGQPAGGGL